MGLRLSVRPERERVLLGHGHVHVLLPMTDVRRQSCTDREEAQLSPGLLRNRQFIRIGVDQTLTGAMRNATTPQFSDEGAGNSWAESGDVTAIREMDDRTVLGDDTVHEVKIAGHV